MWGFTELETLLSQDRDVSKADLLKSETNLDSPSSENVISEEQAARHLNCCICSQLSNWEQAVQHVQSEEDDTTLPEAAEKLVFVRDFSPGYKSMSLKQCPECKTYYLYRTAYEFLIGFGGSYDEQTLSRLSDEAGRDLLKGRNTELLISLS